ncbi:MAG: RDD family protein [Mucilaginibacter sp.]
MPVTCPQCAAEPGVGANYCTACGFDLQQVTVENPVCPVCATEYPTGTSFCPKDGSKLVSHDDLVPRCAICGTVYTDGTKFCPADGGRVTQFGSRPVGQMPEHGILSYPKASLSSRFLACMVDAVITLAFSIPAFICLLFSIAGDYSGNGSSGGLIALALLLYIIPIMYALLKDSLGRGQSWGKRLFSIMVVNLSDNMPCDTGRSALRNLVSALVSAIPFVGWLVEPLMVLITVDGRKIGDMAAKTQVIDIQYYT